MKWLLISCLGLGMHFAASYIVPLDEKAKSTFSGLLGWVWPWAYGNSGPLGILTLGPSGFPLIGFYLAVTSAGLFFLAALALWGIWIPLSWWRMLTVLGAILSIVLMVLFFGPTKILPIAFNIFLIYMVWKNLFPSITHN